MGLFSLVLAVMLSLLFGVAEWEMATRYDHPRLRSGRGFLKWGPVPITHHIPETFTFLFVGWSLQSTKALEQSLMPKVSLPDWLVWVLVVAWVLLTYLRSPSGQINSNSLPNLGGTSGWFWQSLQRLSWSGSICHGPSSELSSFSNPSPRLRTDKPAPAFIAGRGSRLDDSQDYDLRLSGRELARNAQLRPASWTPEAT